MAPSFSQDQPKSRPQYCGLYSRERGGNSLIPSQDFKCFSKVFLFHVYTNRFQKVLVCCCSFSQSFSSPPPPQIRTEPGRGDGGRGLFFCRFC